MKYTLDLEYKGIEVDVNVKAQNEGDKNIAANINVPGNISIKVTGECHWYETWMYFEMLNNLLKGIK